MKILTYKHGGETAVGVLKNDGSEVVPVNYLGCSAIDMNTFLDVQNEKKLEKLDRNKELMQGIPLDEVQILSPIPHPKQDIVCLGINYYAHAEEAARFHDEAFGGERPVPIYFSKRINRALADGELRSILSFLPARRISSRVAYMAVTTASRCPSVIRGSHFFSRWERKSRSIWKPDPIISLK